MISLDCLGDRHHRLCAFNVREVREQLTKVAVIGPKTAMTNRDSAPFVYFAAPKRCWGRLQSRVLFALIDGRGQARTREIASVCWDDPPTPRQIYSQGRACKTIGAVRVRREGREWVWSLQNL